MSIFSWLTRGATKTVEKPKAQKRGMYAAGLGTFGYMGPALEPSHKEIQRDLQALRVRSRDLAKNNAYGHRYLSMCSTHIVGPEGFALEMNLVGYKDKPRDAVNSAVEDAWAAWGLNPTVDGQMDWVGLQQIIAENVATDGEVLLHIVRGASNDQGLAIELIDADRLDHLYNRPVDANGIRVAMGVAMDNTTGQRVGYWIWNHHPLDFEAHPVRVFVPAAEIIHVYVPNRTNSVRGVPWMAPAMNQMQMLGRLWNAELMSAVNASLRMGLVTSTNDITDPTDEGYSVPVDDDAVQSDITAQDQPLDPAIVASQYLNNTAYSYSDEAHFYGVPLGMEIKEMPHPNPALNGFSIELLKGIASALNVSYHALTADVSQASYSSARVALLEERDNWVKMQRWYIAAVCRPIFKVWLENAIVRGIVKVPTTDWQKTFTPIFWGRTWSWIDPKNDTEASVLAIGANLSTLQAELGSLGMNWQKVLEQRAREAAFIKELEAKFHISMTASVPSAAKPQDAAKFDPQAKTEVETAPTTGAADAAE